MSFDKTAQHIPAFSRLTRDQLLTIADLHAFGEELLLKLRTIMGEPNSLPREWLKSVEVMDLLRISGATLRRLRLSGAIGYSKLGSIYYYSYGDIQKLMKRPVP